MGRTHAPSALPGAVRSPEGRPEAGAADTASRDGVRALGLVARRGCARSAAIDTTDVPSGVRRAGSALDRDRRRVSLSPAGGLDHMPRTDGKSAPTASAPVSRKRRLAAIAAAIIVPATTATVAARAPIPPPACSVKLFRWAEDCSALRADRDSLRGLERLRYLPLTESGSAWLTLGGEYRVKTEYLDAPDYGLRRGAQAYTALGERFLAHADLRTSLGVRVFAQLSAA